MRRMKEGFNLRRRARERMEEIKREAVEGPPLRLLWTKWAGTCATCGKEIQKETSAYYRKPDLYCYKEECRPKP